MLSIPKQTRDLTIFGQYMLDTLKIASFDPKGIYYEIAQGLKYDFEGKVVKSINDTFKSQGSVSNLEYVNKFSNSIGLCQFDAYDKTNYENVEIIHKLYYEKLHILVNLKDSIHRKKIQNNGQIIIDCNETNEDYLKQIIGSSNIGEENSGTKITMDILINILNKKCDFQVNRTSIREKNVFNSFLILTHNTIKSAAFMTGDPNMEIKEALELDTAVCELSLIGIDTELLRELSNKSDKYEIREIYNYGLKPITTIGTPALLIAHKNLPKEVAIAAVDFFDRSKKSKSFNGLLSEVEFNDNNISKKFETESDYILKSFVALILLLLSTLISYFFLDYKRVLKENQALKTKYSKEDNTNFVSEHYAKEQKSTNIKTTEESDTKKIELNLVQQRKLTIGINDKDEYFFILDLPDLDYKTKKYSNKDVTNPYKRLLSYAYAKKKGKPHILLDHREYSQYNNNFVLELNRICSIKIKRDDILKKIDKRFELSIDKENIFIENEDKILENHELKIRLVQES